MNSPYVAYRSTSGSARHSNTVPFIGFGKHFHRNCMVPTIQIANDIRHYAFGKHTQNDFTPMYNPWQLTEWFDEDGHIQSKAMAVAVTYGRLLEQSAR